jgi:hypothetical protein
MVGLFNYPFLVITWLLAIIVTIYWIIRYRDLSDSARAIWVLVILLIPYIGAITAILATSDKRKKTDR